LHPLHPPRTRCPSTTLFRSARREHGPVLDERLGQADERREDQRRTRTAEEAREEHVQLPAEADDDERRRSFPLDLTPPACRESPDRKSTRLNSSHQIISYAV